jgi:carbon-monoxide dehydrogenase large subunit
MYGIGGARISAQDGATVRMDPDGSVVVLSGVTEQGQGTEAILAQIVAHGVGVPVERVRVITGDTLTTPYGGGTWACRGAGIGGEAALQSAIALKQQILVVAGSMLQAAPGTLDIRMGQVVDRATGRERMPLGSWAASSTTAATRCRRTCRASWCRRATSSPRTFPFAFTNGIQASWVEVDTDTGMVKLLEHWCVEDCGRVINPLLVDEQVRGGIVQGPRRRALRALRLRRPGQPADHHHGRLPRADVGRDAGHACRATSRRRRRKACSAPRARGRRGPPARRPR